MGDKRSLNLSKNSAVGDNEDMHSDAKVSSQQNKNENTKNVLMNVIKNSSSFGLGQQLSAEPRSPVSRTSRKQPSMQNISEENFDWKFALNELGQESDLLLKNILKTVMIPITELVDAKGLNLLHHAVLKGIDGKTKLLIDFAIHQQMVDEAQIKEWIDAKTFDEGWTPLHYASF